MAAAATSDDEGSMNIRVPDPDACAGDGLLTIAAACQRARRYAPPLSSLQACPVHLSSGRTLAQPVHAVMHVPAFDQSAMDGYAIALGGVALPIDARAPVVARVAAGENPPALETGQAARIFTGAPLPVGADAVLMQEHGARHGGEIVLGRGLRPGDNIRRLGEDVGIGDLLLPAGTRIDARHVGILATQGLTQLTVLERIRVGIISTGNELRQPGSAPAPAMIYDANRPMLMVLAASAGLDVVDGGWVPDDPVAISRKLSDLSERCHLVVTTGGASVGDEDHSATAIGRAGGEFEVLRIALRPGKPAVVGRLGSATYLGLPGNPVSALVSWLIVGRAVIASLEGREHVPLSGMPMTLASPFERRPGRTDFVPARVVRGDAGLRLRILGHGGSARMRPLVDADGLAEIDAMHVPVQAGDTVRFHPFRDGFAP
jgi:molybdopterin molybdotransferase